MKKTSSSEALNRLGERESTGRRIRRSSSLGRPVAGLGRGRKVKSDQDLKHLCGTPSGFGKAPKRSATVASAGALPYHAPPQNVMSTEVAEDVFEASFARGLAAAECFELYGPVRKAPELTGASPSPTHTDRSQQLATSQQLASCLATPFTGTDRNMGEILRSEVDKMDANRELQTQLRYAEELRQRREAREEEDEELEDKLEEPSIRRARLRRKPSDEVLDEQLMQEVAISGYKQAIKGPGDLPSPAAKVTLDSIYSSMDDTSNKLLLPDPINEDETGNGAKLDAPGGKHQLKTKPFSCHIDVMAMSCAPDLY